MTEMSRTGRPPPVGPEEQAALEAWGLLLRTHASLTRGLDAVLRERAGLPLTAYDVLAHVAAAPDRRIRMHHLERKVLFSQSTVSRLAARLEREGLVERVVADDDRRALVVRLTGAGARVFGAARGVATEFLREHVVAALPSGRAELLRDSLRALSPDEHDEGGIPM